MHDARIMFRETEGISLSLSSCPGQHSLRQLHPPPPTSSHLDSPQLVQASPGSLSWIPDSTISSCGLEGPEICVIFLWSLPTLPYRLHLSAQLLYYIINSQ